MLEDIHGAAEKALGNQREEEQIGKRTREEQIARYSGPMKLTSHFNVKEKKHYR